MVFLPGDHVLDTNITVVNVTRLTMHGESSSDNMATVVPNGSVGFSFTNMVDFNIHSLAFTSYNRFWSHPASNPALIIQFSLYATLVNCSFHDNIGIALAIYNTNITLAGNSQFMGNKCACTSLSKLRELGCGITTFHSNITFIGNTTFLKNSQTSSSSSCAGAIWASVSSLQFNETNTFIGNSADDGGGGAIYAQTKTSLSFTGMNTFSHNSANRGGAVCTVDSGILVFNGINSFINNSAQYGGAIYAKSSTWCKFIGTSIFSVNSADYGGGAIHTEYDVVLSFIGINSFINNSA